MAGYADADCTGGPEFVVGAARGRRTFHLGPDGWLRGVTYRVPWANGENVARCMATRVRADYDRTVYQRHIGGWRFEDGTYVPELAKGFEPIPCSGVEKNCTCGFYAYHRGTDTYHAIIPDGIRVEAVVEAYGKLVLGPLGFRAQKARILAVCLPDRDSHARQMREVARMVAALKQDLLLLDVGRIPMAGAVLTWIAAAAIAVAGGTLAGLPFGLRVGAAFASGVLAVGGVAQRNYHKGEVLRQRTKLNEAILSAQRQLEWLVQMNMNSVRPTLREQVQRLYPDVEVYTNHEQMQAEWPVSSLAYLTEEAEPCA